MPHAPGTTVPTARPRTRIAVAALAGAALVAACGSSETDSATADSATADSATEATATEADAGDGVRVISVEEAATLRADAPPDLVVLDVRTPEEFAEGHLEGAILIDFYDEDFASHVADLDRDVPYLLYCRSGNRSGQARELMAGLDFVDVADVDGGILAWTDAALPVVVG